MIKQVGKGFPKYKSLKIFVIKQKIKPEKQTHYIYSFQSSIQDLSVYSLTDIVLSVALTGKLLRCQL